MDLARKYKVFLIIDEGHELSNPKSQQFKTVKSLRDRSSACTILTGTPLLNHIEGLYTVINLVHPKFFSSLRDFESRYLIKESKDINVKGILRTIQITVGHRNLEELRSRLEEICITRNIKYNIIPKFYSVELEPEIMKIYSEAAQGLTGAFEAKLFCSQAF